MDSRFFEDMYVRDVSVISGIRPSGRSVDHSERGRKNSGILYVMYGEAVFRSDSHALIRVGNGELVFIPKRKKYKMEFTGDKTTFVLIDFNTYLHGGAEVLLDKDITVLKNECSPADITRMMASLELLGSSKDLFAVLRRKELFYRLISAVWANYVHSDPDERKRSRIAEGVALLEKTYLEAIPISKFAEVSHVSENTFRAIFQKQYKTSPVQYRNRLRIARARELLSEGSATVAETAWNSGFENVGYFCRLYKKITGENPSETKKLTDN